MKTSAKGVAFIAAWEGIVTKAYRDVAGVWTIGVGHTAAAGAPVPRAGMVITRRQALEILASDLPKYEARVGSTLPGVVQPAGDGSVSFDFNTGAIRRASWVKAYKDGDMVGVRRGLALWKKAGGKVVRGLVNRRAAEADLIVGGKYGKAAEALVSSIGDAFKPDIAPSVADQQGTGDVYRERLARLGFTGDQAALRYQQTHPDLVNDNIIGPATRAQIDRDLARPQPTPEVSDGSWLTALLNLILSLFKQKG